MFRIPSSLNQNPKMRRKVGGIPGFPYGSIIMGLAIGVIIFGVQGRPV